MNKYDVIALVIAAAVVIGLIIGGALLSSAIADFVDKTKSND